MCAKGTNFFLRCDGSSACSGGLQSCLGLAYLALEEELLLGVQLCVQRKGLFVENLDNLCLIE